VNAAPRIEFEAAGLDGATTLNSAIVCPLKHNDRVVGALALYHVDPGRYTDDHGRLLARVAEQTAAVVGNSLVFEQTQEDSLTDPLTGLPNRRSLVSRLLSEIARAERMRGELAVIVLDVDGFKQINDTHGHSVGDLVLREIARTLLASLRTYDMCVRYAGDEFVIVLGDCPPDAAELKRQELQRHIEDIDVLVDGKPVPVGASAGVAVFAHDGRTHDVLLATADRRMYSDKALRRRFARATSARLPREWDTAGPTIHPARPTRPN
jgi:diguanylate cyclase (GGDEF)-like protein